MSEQASDWNKHPATPGVLPNSHMSPVGGSKGLSWQEGPVSLLWLGVWWKVGSGLRKPSCSQRDPSLLLCCPMELTVRKGRFWMA